MPAGRTTAVRRPARLALWLGLLLAVVVVAAGAATLASSHGADPPAGPALWIASGPTGRVELHRGWHVALDPSDQGLSHRWANGRFGGRAVTVPYSPNADHVTGPEGIVSFHGSVAWYRRTLRVGRSGRYDLRFESVNHDARVWVDGREVARHRGTYLPFDVRVPLTAGRAHTLVVRADWRDPAQMKREGWHRTWFNFGGINREVSLRRIGRSEVLAPSVTTRLAGGGTALVDLSVAVRNDTAATRSIPVTGTLAHDGQSVGFRLAGVPVAPGAHVQLHTTLRVPHAALWAPGSPNLYDLDLQAGGGAAQGEGGYHVRVGLRQLTWAGGTLKINGRPVELRGASLQEDVAGRGDALRPADQARLVRELKSIGANATRSQHPLDVGLLERLDAAGILVWQGVGPVDAPGAWTNDTPAMLHDAHLRVLAITRQDQAHPSIIAWNLVNEVAGNGHDPTEVAYVDDAARTLRQTDPGRMIALDVWGLHPPTVAGPIYAPVDAVGVTDYLGWYEPPVAPRAAVVQAIEDRMNRMRQVFAGKVLIVSEFGAEANGQNPTDRPGGYRFQTDLLETHLDAYRHVAGLSGTLVWDLRDFAVAPSFAGGSIRHVAPDIQLVRGLNQKGLIDYLGRPKPSAAAIRRAFGAEAAAARAHGGL